MLKLTRFESEFWICKFFWDKSTNAKVTDFFVQKFENRWTGLEFVGCLKKKISVKNEKRKGKEFSKKKMCPAWQTKWMKYQVIGDQSKEEKIWNLHWIGISLWKKERKKGKKSRHFCQFEWFPAIPSPILPIFCHGNEVRPWKFQKNLLKISFVWPKGKRKKVKIN